MLSFAVAIAGCVSRAPATPSRTAVARLAHGYFLTAVAAVPNKHYRLYWLGTSFAVGRLTFTGPYHPGFGENPDPNGMAYEYEARLTSSGGVSLDLTVLSQASWPAYRDNLLRAAPGISVTSTTVGGHTAEVLRTGTTTRPVNQLWVSVDLRDAVVIANAPSGGVPVGGGADANPLIDEQTLLAVLQHLRPYPQ